MRLHSGHPYITQHAGETRERGWRHTCSPPLQFNSRPPCLLQPVSFALSLSLPTSLLLSSTPSNRPRDCVMRTPFQINRLQRVMKARGGYEKLGGGEWGTRVSMTTAQDSCSWNERACVCEYVWYCVLVQGLHGGETPSHLFLFIE